MQGAEFGQGAVLGNRLLCSRLLASGRLVAPFDLAIPNGAYWIVARDFERITTPQAAFIEWLYARARQPGDSRPVETDRESMV